MKRLLKWKRLRWFALGTLVRYLLKRTTARSVDRAAAEMEERLPAPVRKVMDIVPADAVRVGGSAVVMGRTARRMAVGTRRVSQVAGNRKRRVSEGIGRLRSIGDEVVAEAELRRRELKAEYLRVTEGNGAADEIMLDLRNTGSNGAGDGYDEPDLPEITDPVRRGRWRAERRLGPATVNRVQRSYRPQSRPWDR